MTRCRLCTTNDLDGLIEEVAREMWEGYKAENGKWDDNAGYWQIVFRNYARSMMTVLHREHAE